MKHRSSITDTRAEDAGVPFDWSKHRSELSKKATHVSLVVQSRLIARFSILSFWAHVVSLSSIRLSELHCPSATRPSQTSSPLQVSEPPPPVTADQGSATSDVQLVAAAMVAVDAKAREMRKAFIF